MSNFMGTPRPLVPPCLVGGAASDRELGACWSASDGGSDAAVYWDDGAGDVGPRPGGQDGRPAGGVVWPAGALQGSRVGARGSQCLEGGGHHLGRELPWRRGVDAIAAAAPLKRIGRP